MADVQLEDGYVRLANRLLEAIIDAGFSEKQLRILMALIRLTYGWGCPTVRMSELDLARYSGVHNDKARRAGGAFRADLHELITQGVVVRIDTKERGIWTWAINKDYSAWGRFSVFAQHLESKWSARPKSVGNDAAVIKDEVARIQATNAMSEWPEPSPYKEAEWPAPGPDSGPLPGHTMARTQATSISEDVESLEVTAVERQRKTEKDKRTTTACEPAAVTDYAVGLVVAANNTITEKWNEQPNPLTHGSAAQLAADLIGQAIPLPLAQQAIAASIRKSRQPEAPKSIEYFRPVVIAAWRADEQRRLNGSTPTGLRGGHMATIGAVLGQPSKSAETREVEWQRERRDAAVAWGKDPANESAYRAIAAAAKVRLHDFADTTWGEKAIASEVIEQCAVAVAFPTFLDWRRSRDESA